MSNGRDWLYRPVRMGMCSVEALLDGTVDLDIVADMNEALDTAEENQSRYNQSLNKNG